ncbi:SRPBCC family protein [Bradyrhizobium septentrionale]|uniref:SRPBCC domain-containing protein n=1 Tax=Bradyrhizobium septentrionale TaxID=1404411 RepID=A0A973W423_9BRAD|nr:SRPBCC domain-containing protein [Bradyrhizobium septentrionale]UGY15905.1 SRPBCC domain-containing protein [Bradyrhizobium septentrionale]UGY24479.1 SRPBCC domain-containing protein [Bradyrhizobium septentrionale]
MAETHAITVEKVLPYAADKIWRTLTTSDLLVKWLMPNDFVAVVGHRFNFRTRPIGGWDGVVHCEVLDYDPPRLLRYSWKGGADTNPEYGSKLDSVVTWTLTPVEGGTQVRMVHDGFVFPGNRYAFDMMSPGWGKIVDAIGRVAAEA